ncbi:MAG: hypothetical protein KJO07_23645 [Deltaproteobacteria bacterium]|nr:hypothetical protein [Deltaproteobacteria bacterium]
MHAKGIFSAFVAGLLLLATAATADADKKRNKETLYCRGGGAIKAMYSEYTPNPYYKQRMRRSTWYRNLTITFERGLTPAPRPGRGGRKSAAKPSHGPPGPGQCVFSDRGMAKGDPNMLRKSWHTKPPTVKRGARPGQWISQINITPRSIKIAKVEGAELDTLIRAISQPTMIYTVTVSPKVKKGVKWWEIATVGKSFKVSDWANR